VSKGVGSLVGLLFRLLNNRIPFLHPPIFFCGDILDWEESTSSTLGGHHLVELAFARFLKVASETLLNDSSLAKDVDEVIRSNLGEVVRDYDSCPLLSPRLDCLEDKQTRGYIEGGSRFVCYNRISKVYLNRLVHYPPRIKTVGLRMNALAIANRCF